MHTSKSLANFFQLLDLDRKQLFFKNYLDIFTFDQILDRLKSYLKHADDFFGTLDDMTFHLNLVSDTLITYGRRN